MKTIRVLTTILACCLYLLGAASFVVVVSTGCAKTQSLQKREVNTLYSIHKAVDAGYDSYLDLVIAKAIPTNSLPKVSREYASFQRVYNAAIVTVAGNTNAVASGKVMDAATTFGVVVESAKKGN